MKKSIVFLLFFTPSVSNGMRFSSGDIRERVNTECIRYRNMADRSAWVVVGSMVGLVVLQIMGTFSTFNPDIIRVKDSWFEKVDEEGGQGNAGEQRDKKYTRIKNRIFGINCVKGSVITVWLMAFAAGSYAKVQEGKLINQLISMQKPG